MFRRSSRKITAPVFEELEPRLLFSAEMPGLVADPYLNQPEVALLTEIRSPPTDNAASNVGTASPALTADAAATASPSNNTAAQYAALPLALEPSRAQVDFPSANADPSTGGGDLFTNKSNYLTGNDSLARHTDITNYNTGSEQPSTSATLHEIAFVDTQVKDYQRLVDDLKNQANGDRQIEVVLLDGNKDGIQQISEALSQHQDLTAVHIISHGADGVIRLGNAALDANFLSQHADEIAHWGDAFASDGDLLLYGCDLAASDDGRALLTSLSKLSGTDVAASDDLTGSARLGGDWVLEFHVGQVDTSVALTLEAQAAFTGVLVAPTIDLDANNSSGATGADYKAQYPVAGSSLAITDIDAKLADADSTNLSSLTVTITNPLNGANESLSAVTTGTSITASYDSGTGVLTLSGPDTVGHYQEVLRTIGYENTAVSPDRTARTIIFQIDDGAGTSNVGTTTVGWDYVRDDFNPAAYNGNDGSVNWNGNWQEYGDDGNSATGRVTVSSGVLDRDVSGLFGDSTLRGAHRGVDLSQAGTAILSLDYRASSLTLLGNTTVAVQVSSDGGTNWNTVLSTGSGTLLLSDTNWRTASVDISAYATANTRIRLVGSSSALLSLSGSVQFDNVEIRYDIHGAAPSLDLDANNSSGATGANFATTFTEGGGAVTVADADAVLADTDSATLTELIATITNPLDGAAESLAANTAGTSITAAYDSATGTLTLSGADTVARYQQVLRTITYNNTSDNPNTSSRIITLAASDGVDPSNIAMTSATVTAVNDTPTLDNTKSPALTAINEDAGAPSGAVGTLVPQLVDFASPSGQVDNVTDVDSGALLGIAVTAADTTNGAWWYSTDNGSNWNALGAVANNNARLLAADANTRLYFQPNADYNGTIANAITFRAWDQTSGTNGSLADTSTNGGSTAFSTATASASITVNSVNDAPQGTNQTVTTLEDTAYTFSTADFGFSDPNDSPANVLTAVRVTTLSGAGSLTDNGVAVSAGQLVSVADINAGKLVFAPAANANGAGYASFSFQVQDDGGSANGGVDLDPSPKTLMVNVTSVNDAPVLAGANNLTAINEDPASNPGTLVSVLIAGQVTDPDSGALSGIAVTAVDNSNGSWQYSTDGGASWTAFGAPLAAAARLLAADANTSVRFVPNANWNGTVTGGLTFRAWDQTSGTNGSLADTSTNGGGTAFSSANASASITVNSVNDAAQGTNQTVTTLEDTAYTFTTSDFGFSDPNDSPANVLTAVKITSLPGAGSLTDNGVAVSAGQLVSVADINAGKLVFTPAANANGAGYASFSFQVQDDGGTANGGVDLDPAPRTMTVNVTSVNDAPQGTNQTVTTLEDTAYTFTTSDFGFSDPNDSPANVLTAVKITSLPGAGSLTLSGVAVTAGQLVSAANLSAGNLKFTPAANANGAGYASFSFQMQDDGGTANGGVDLDPTLRTMTVNVTAVNDAPAGTNNTVSTNEDTDTFTAGDFGFSDVDAGDSLSAVRIDTLPLDGSLTRSGSAVSAGDVILVADLTAGNLIFTPAANANGAGYASFSFSVCDQSSAFDATPNTLTVNVSAVNDAPAGTNNTVSINEDTAYTFTTGDFGFSDVDAGDAFSAVRIDSVPTAGSLTLAGVAVNGGDVITAAQLAAGNLVFTPAANANGAGYASFTFSVRDSANAFDATPNTLTVNVTAVNDAPAGTNNTVSTNEDTAYTFAAAGDFGFSDVDAGDAFSAVRIDSVPTAGSLTLAGVAVNGGDVITAAQLAAGNLVFTPAANANGAGYASFTFSVRDSANAFDATPNTLTVNVTAVNDAPAGTNNTVSTNEDTAYTFAAAGDFGFSDVDAGDSMSAVRIDTLPLAGSLALSGSAVSAGDVILVADITAGNLVFTPAANANGAGYASFTFSVRDSANAFDATPNTLTVNVSALNDAPAGLPTITGTVTEDQTLTADTSGLGDADGLGTFSYHWQRSTDGGSTWSNVGANSAYYTLGDADVGAQMRVQVGYTDGQGTPESLTSAATAPVGKVNDAPAGASSIVTLGVLVDPQRVPPTTTETVGNNAVTSSGGSKKTSFISTNVMLSKPFPLRTLRTAIPSARSTA